MCQRFIDAIGGLQVGAVPLTTAAVISYDNHGPSIEGFWVREEIKTHGTQKLIEGGLQKGMRVAIVDDVFAQGGSAFKAVQAVRAFGCEVVLVLALVDRLQRARESIAQHGIAEYRSVFTVEDFGIHVPIRAEAAAVYRAFSISFWQPADRQLDSSGFGSSFVGGGLRKSQTRPSVLSKRSA